MSLISYLKKSGPSGFGYRSTCYDVLENIDLTGKTMLITGCNSGLGKEMAQAASKKGARIIGVARTEDKAKNALLGMKEAVPIGCDLSEPSQVLAAVEKALTNGAIDALVCNAGIMALPKAEIKYGIELQFLTNHIGHYILVNGLKDSLPSKARIILVSSAAHFFAPLKGVDFDRLSSEKHYNPWLNYGQSKLANILFARELSSRLNEGQSAHAVHPGVILTNLSRHLNPIQSTIFSLAPMFMKNTSQGAATQTYAAFHPDVKSSGDYWVDCNISQSSRKSKDKQLALDLWNFSAEFVNKYN